MAKESRHDILFVEDNTLIREALCLMIKERKDFKVVAEVESGEKAIEYYRDNRPDLVLMDLSLPGISGIEAIRQICDIDPEAKILVLTKYPEDGYVYRSFEAGASGYIHKGTSANEFFLAMSYVTNGYKFISPLVASKILDIYLMAQKDFKPIPGIDTLSKREAQVFELVGKQMKSTEIGSALGISIKTVEKHRSNILTKLHLKNPRDLPKVAVQAYLMRKNKKKK